MLTLDTEASKQPFGRWDLQDISNSMDDETDGLLGAGLPVGEGETSGETSGGEGCSWDHARKRWTGYWRDWTALFVLGTINNLAYVVINSSAQALSQSFNQLWIYNLIGLIPLSNSFSSFFIRFFNTWALESVSHRWRLLGNAVAMALSIFLLGMGKTPFSSISLVLFHSLGLDICRSLKQPARWSTFGLVWYASW